ncbi:unnamed protein product, partial [Trichogramma brassicae]
SARTPQGGVSHCATCCPVDQTAGNQCNGLLSVHESFTRSKKVQPLEYTCITEKLMAQKSKSRDVNILSDNTRHIFIIYK